jgi:hypothetical protein
MRAGAVMPAREWASLLVAVFGGVVFCGFPGVVRGVGLMAVRHLRVMGCLLMVAGFVVIGGGGMVLGGVLVVFGGFAVMLGGILRHGEISLGYGWPGSPQAQRTD